MDTEQDQRVETEEEVQTIHHQGNKYNPDSLLASSITQKLIYF